MTRRRKSKRKTAVRPLTAKQRLFVAEYLANGHNATRAYMACHPKCLSYDAARVKAHETVTNGNVQRAIALAQAARFKRLEMNGDEAIALLSLSARADIKDIYDPETGALLPVHQWPDSVRLAVKSVKANGDIVLHDGLRARELMAQAAGRIKNTVDVNHRFDHAAYLADEAKGEK